MIKCITIIIMRLCKKTAKNIYARSFRVIRLDFRVMVSIRVKPFLLYI